MQIRQQPIQARSTQWHMITFGNKIRNGIIHQNYQNSSNIPLSAFGNQEGIGRIHRSRMLSQNFHSIEEAEHFATNILPPGFLVVHDASRGCQDNVPKLHVKQ